MAVLSLNQAYQCYLKYIIYSYRGKKVNKICVKVFFKI
jgi:hypothetical protein